MQLNGSTYQPRSKQDAEKAGVQIVQQELNLIPTLSVAENLYFARYLHTLGWIRYRKLKDDAAKLLADFDLNGIDIDAAVSQLGVGHSRCWRSRRTLCEIANC